MLAEFDIISRCFDQPGLAAGEDDIVRLGIGDDCALLAVPPGKQLAISMDTLVAGVHFPEDADPALVANRALAVNLSDLAAMGAEPRVFTLSLTLPESNDDWLAGFAAGLRDIAQRHHCFLVGGDISRGPLAVTIQVHGLVAPELAIRRSGAMPGDRIYVTGSLGCAGLALSLFGDHPPAMADRTRDDLLAAYFRPRPRLDAARALAEYVSAGIDISDGLLGDLQHICERSGCGARVNAADVPVAAGVNGVLGPDDALALALTAGDDYELILTVPVAKEAGFLAAAGHVQESLTRIGEMCEGRDVACVDEAGKVLVLESPGYTHFREAD